jgi:hypothetical protein
MALGSGQSIDNWRNLKDFCGRAEQALSECKPKKLVASSERRPILNFLTVHGKLGMLAWRRWLWTLLMVAARCCRVKCLKP